MLRFVLTTAAIWTQVAQAQIALPPLRLPVTPPTSLGRTLQQPGDTLDSRYLQDVRKLRIRELLRAHRDVLEEDPNGAPIVRGEVLVYAPTDLLLSWATSAGFKVLRVLTFDSLAAKLVVLRPPEGVSSARALKRLRALDPAAAIDFNHLYTDSGGAGSAPGSAAGSDALDRPVAGASIRLGLIDGGVDTAHPVFTGLTLHQHGCDGKPVASAHGTAVASLMVGRSAGFQGAAAGAELFAVDVYCGAPTGGAVDAVAEAFAWLLEQRVAVINVSLVGPPNMMLQTVVSSLLAHGCIVVAAVGNDGPAAPPHYPAAYPGVIGVTAVDSRRKVLIEAGRGHHVKFAAPGADMAAADLTGRFAVVRGTSFAAPIVAGLLAAQGMIGPDRVAADKVIGALIEQAIDLGAPGPDVIYGYGLVGAQIRPEVTLARQHGGSQ